MFSVHHSLQMDQSLVIICVTTDFRLYLYENPGVELVETFTFSQKI